MTKQEMEDMLKADLKHIHFHNSPDWTMGKLIQVMQRVYDQGMEDSKSNLREVVFDVAAIVLQTPYVYPEGGGPVKQCTPLIEYKLNQYINERISKAKAENKGT